MFSTHHLFDYLQQIDHLLKIVILPHKNCHPEQSEGSAFASDCTGHRVPRPSFAWAGMFPCISYKDLAARTKPSTPTEPPAALHHQAQDSSAPGRASA